MLAEERESKEATWSNVFHNMKPLLLFVCKGHEILALAIFVQISQSEKTGYFGNRS